MAPKRDAGMDHEHYPWSPIITRRPLAWPNGARLAVCVIINLECLDWIPPEGSYQAPLLYTHLAPIQRPLPELWTMAIREYGHRVGIFRLMNLLGRHGIRPMVSMDALTASRYPYLVRYCLDRGCEIIAHGLGVSRMITSRMSETEERRYIAETLDVLEGATGSRPQGWHGPEYGESERTPQLLAELGVRYVCDWANDEQPYRMTTASGELYALPIMIELDDVFALRDRRYRVDEYVRQIVDAVDVMRGDAIANGRVFVLNLHAWMSGQPFRVRFLTEAIARIMSHADVWTASGSEIIDSYRKQMGTHRARGGQSVAASGAR
ncbi:MAG TPA: polysaccharide deacetylase family protein [Pseudolabrys sp.]|nr:polysaccharide deacetylase family protein [Pseudolabrys sp.]